MANEPTCYWTGASGKAYTYWVYPRRPNINPNQSGNYIYARLTPEGWVPIYIGEGELSVRCTDSHHQQTCINRRKATHVHMHVNDLEAARFAEESDLLGNYVSAYAPTGCNVRIGG